MKTFLIEREIPSIGQAGPDDLKGAAAKSNEAIAKLEGKVAWKHSYVTEDKTFCIYEAEDEAAIEQHAELSGFPADKITEIGTVIDPSLGG